MACARGNTALNNKAKAVENRMLHSDMVLPGILSHDSDPPARICPGAAYTRGIPCDGNFRIGQRLIVHAVEYDTANDICLSGAGPGKTAGYSASNRVCAYNS
jgi:hypothetical protein